MFGQVRRFRRTARPSYHYGVVNRARRRNAQSPAPSTTVGTVSQVLDDFTVSASGEVTLLEGDLSVTLDDFTVAAAGNIPTSGSLAVTLDDFQLISSGSLVTGFPTLGNAVLLTDVSTKYKFKAIG